jgi:hypothetical protein
LLLVFQLAATLGQPSYLPDAPGAAIGALILLGISASITVAGIHGRVWKRDDS